MSDDTIEPFGFPAVGRKKVTAAFDGGRLTSDGGVMLLAAAERRLGIAERLAASDLRPAQPAVVTHSVADILRARILAIACGYEDADDLDHLRSDPGFKLACGRLPDTGRDLCSQPTMSRWENAPTLREVMRMSYAMVDLYCASYARPPAAVTLDIDDTVDVVHGHQQMSLFNAHYDERCFLPIHVYDTATSRPVTMLLRPGKTPSGEEVRGHHPSPGAPHPDAHWPKTRLTIRGDGHYARPEVMTWCEANAVAYIFGLPGNAVLSRWSKLAADDIRVRRAEAQATGDAPLHRGPLRRQILEVPAARGGQDRGQQARPGYPLRGDQPGRGSAEWLYDTLYCARGQAENLIKLHKSQLASDRTSCRSALANQVRLVLHTAAYWLMLTLRDAIPKQQPLATAEFATLRMRLLKIAARVTETATRVRIAFAAACPEAISSAASRSASSPPGRDPRGLAPNPPGPATPTPITSDPKQR